MEVSKEDVKFGLLPKKGDVVTYEYERFSRREVPVNVKIDRIRHDTSWEALLHDYQIEEERKVEQNKNQPAGILFNFFSFALCLISFPMSFLF